MELQRCTLKGLASIGTFLGWRMFLRGGDKIIGGLGHDDHIINVSFNVAADLLIEAHLDSPLISCPGVLESKGHGGVAVRIERRDERCLDLVFFLEGDLVIAGVTIGEGEQFTTGGGVYNLIYPR